MKKILTLLLLFASLTLTAQRTPLDSARIARETTHNGRLYLQVLGGINHSMNEDLRFDKFSHALRYGGQILLGRDFTPYWGTNIAVAYNRGRGMAHYSILPHEYNSFNAVEVFLNAVYNLTDGFTGLKKHRKGFLYGYVGLGAAYTYGLDDRDTQNAPKDNNFAVGFRAGLEYVYNFSRRIAGVADFGVTAFSDNYNGRSAGVPLDFHVNPEIGVRIYLGVDRSPWETGDINLGHENLPVITKYVDREKIVYQTDTVYVHSAEAEAEANGYNNAKVFPIFFAINSTEIRDNQTDKMQEMAKYLADNPQKIVFVIGHADVNTGNAKINYTLGKNRSHAVSESLKNDYGIDASRIVNITEEGDRVQPYKNDFTKNRVAICIVTDFSE